MGASQKRLKRSIFESAVDGVMRLVDPAPVEYTPVSSARAKKIRKKRDAEAKK